MIFGILSSLQDFCRMPPDPDPGASGNSSEFPVGLCAFFGFPGRRLPFPTAFDCLHNLSVNFFYNELFTFSTEFSTTSKSLCPNGYTDYSRIFAYPVMKAALFQDPILFYIILVKQNFPPPPLPRFSDRWGHTHLKKLYRGGIRRRSCALRQRRDGRKARTGPLRLSRPRLRL